MPPRPVFVVTGTSGAGKGTIERELLARMPELELAISATTRPRREGEANGREYWFISDEEFDRKLAAREFLEHIVFDWGQRSGTLRSEIDRILDAGRIPLRDRATESEGEIEERLELARRQLEQEDLFDHVIVNDHLDRSVEELEAIVRGALQS